MKIQYHRSYDLGGKNNIIKEEMLVNNTTEDLKK